MNPAPTARTPPIPRSDRWSRVLPWIFLALCAAIFLRVSTLGWHNNLLGYSGFRQAQTAINTDYLLRDGFTLAYQTPVLGAPWALPFEFPTYQVCVAALVKLTGLPLEPAGRLVSLAFALGAFAFLFLFVRHAAASLAAAAFATALALVTPLYLFYSRTFMIESTALCFSLALLVSVQRWISRPTFVATIWILLAGTLAALTKATTYAVALAALAALILVSLRETWPRLHAHPRSRLLLLSFFLSLALPFALALVWVAWTDAVKLRNELAAFTTSAALHDWNYGTWSQRLDPHAWSRLAQGISSLIAGFPWLWLAAFVLAAATLLFVRRLNAAASVPSSRLPAFALVCAAGFAAGPLAFMNLYVVHDYYFYATAIFFPAFAGALLGALWDGHRFARFLSGTLALVLAAASVHTYAQNCHHVQIANDPAIPALGAKIAELTPPDSVLFIEGSEWDSSLAYYAGRRALTNRTAAPLTDPVLQRAFARLDRPIGAVVFRELRKDDRYFMARQMRGFRRPFERVHASPVGDVYLPIGDNQPLRREAEWRAAGFAMLPLFAWAPAVELSQIAGRPGMLVHAPGVLVFAREPQHTTLHVSYGLRDDAYTGNHRTDGVSFNVEFDPDDGGPMQRLLTAELNPADHPDHRGLHTAAIPLPPGIRGTLTFYTETRASDAYDWSIWCDVRLE
jgi:hypothetical protein